MDTHMIIKASSLKAQKNEQPATSKPISSPSGSGLKVRTHITAGSALANHNQTLVKAEHSQP